MKPSLSTRIEPIDIADRRAEPSTLPNKSREAETETVIREFRRRRSPTRPTGELSAETRTFARMIASLTEEGEAIGWYEQRMSVETDKDARAIMQNAQQEEFKHFAMDLEFLTRRTEKWQIALKTTLFTDGDIVEAGARAEEAEGLG
jgi:uncharacterized protein